MKDKETKKIADGILKHTRLHPKTGIILGSGFSALCDRLEGASIVRQGIRGLRWAAAPRFGLPAAHAPVLGHEGLIVSGRLGGADIIVFKGRRHFYEGYSNYAITESVRIIKRLGCENIILTNAAGAVNTAFKRGDFALINDHISNNLANPLIGDFENRFVDMTKPYDGGLKKLFLEQAKKRGIDIKEGVYMYFSGPTYETPSDIKAARALGADLVGMSTVAEVVMARYCGLKVLAISYVGNMAAGIEDKIIEHSKILYGDEKQKNAIFDCIAGLCEKLK
jgi:purine-nucleoside phosphorylase